LAGEFLTLVDEWSMREASGRDSSELLQKMQELIGRLMLRRPEER
jgi:hypothetical protein